MDSPGTQKEGMAKDDIEASCEEEVVIGKEDMERGKGYWDGGLSFLPYVPWRKKRTSQNKLDRLFQGYVGERMVCKNL